jgi:hypothetical protein
MANLPSMGRYQSLPQMSFGDAESLISIRPLGANSLWVRLRDVGDRLLPNGLFDALYSVNGRPAIPPSSLTRLLLLELRTGCGDREAVENLNYDVRWQYACNLRQEQCDIHPTTLSKFRLRLLFGTIDREKINELKCSGVVLRETPAYGHMQAVLDGAVEIGILDREAVKGIDSTAIFGAAAVQDSYRLMFQGLRAAIEAHAKAAKAEEHDQLLAALRRAEYSSEQKKPDIDWNDPAARKALLVDYLEDTVAVLVACKEFDDPDVIAAMAQLAKLVGQDLDLSSGEVELLKGVAPDRQCSVTDPEMRHGRKSASKRFNGSKGHAMVDPESELVTDVAVTPASEHDGAAGETLLEHTEAKVAVGDNAYAGAEVRAKALMDGTVVITPAAPAGEYDKDSFVLNEDGESMTCPAEVTAPIAPSGRVHFPAKSCRACPFAQQCNPKGNGRTLQIQDTEALQRHLRAYARTEKGRELIKWVRSTTERVIGHWVRWGLRQGRYFGTAKTGLQAVLAATGHNLDKIGRHTAWKDREGTRTGDAGGCEGPWGPSTAPRRSSMPVCGAPAAPGRNSRHNWQRFPVSPHREPARGRRAGGAVFQDLPRLLGAHESARSPEE